MCSYGPTAKSISDIMNYDEDALKIEGPDLVRVRAGQRKVVQACSTQLASSMF